MSGLMLLFAFMLNYPYIIIQRYNRPRIIKILEHEHDAPKTRQYRKDTEKAG